MEARQLEYVMVPLGFAVLVGYHLWLVITIHRRPRITVIGINAESRRQWVSTMIQVSAFPSLSLTRFSLVSYSEKAYVSERKPV